MATFERKGKVVCAVAASVLVLLLYYSKNLHQLRFSKGKVEYQYKSATDKVSLPCETTKHTEQGKQTPVPTKEAGIQKFFNTEANFGSKEWRLYYSELAVYLASVEDGIYQWPLPVANTTSAKYSRLEIQKPAGRSFKVGDILHAVIHAKNGYDEPKAHGGDYFHARLIGAEDKNALAVSVEDLGNGQYNITAPLMWANSTTLIVELVHSSEAVATLVNETTSYVGGGATFVGVYQNGEKKECNVGLNKIDPLNVPCNYSYPDKGGSWFCYSPTKTACTPLKWLAVRDTPKQSIQLGRRPLFTTDVNWKAQITGSGESFDVVENGFTNASIRKRPTCSHLSGVSKSAFVPAFGDTPGLFIDDHWVSLQCRNTDIVDLDRAASCFRDKTVYLIGDSTLRQWFAFFADLLSLNETDKGNKAVWQRPRHGYDAKHNVTVHYFGHGPPLYGDGPPATRPYVVDTLRAIPPGNGKGMYVVLNLALHFCLYDPSVYIYRIRAIRRAVVDLLHRSPEIVVLVRGCLRHKHSRPRVPSEWFSFRLCKIQRALFAEVPNVGFIDTWSMTTAHLQAATHPDESVVAQHIALFTSYVCPLE